MARLVVLALALMLTSSCFASQRIIGGRPAYIEQYPSLVQVEEYTDGVWWQKCAGNILNILYVLSAAHCFEGPYYDPLFHRIRSGSTYRHRGGNINYVEKEFNHPSYDVAAPLDGDITVVRLSRPIIYSNTVGRATINYHGARILDNIPVVYAGWGDTIGEYAPPEQLLDVQVYTINNDLCRERYMTLDTPPNIITRNMICAGVLDVGGRDACHGDSGGPLYDGKILIGIISWGEGCANATFPGVNANVASYTNWIAETAV
ncbi:hypothetical protein ABMA28_008448 [Loxostege sticticalis]|uniref:Peptidase S1 domain-containing protein n=1 Tax=Loxostege sticticalis TaxID=481309 RepID=A0ABD0SL52_LOXSC